MGQQLSNYYRQHTNGYLGDMPKFKVREYMVIDDRVHKIHKVTVHKFTVGDSDDPILYAAQPIIDWQNSEQGQWVMEHSVETPEWNRFEDPMNWGHSFYITAKLKEKDYSFYLLKWGK